MEKTRGARAKPIQSASRADIEAVGKPLDEAALYIGVGAWKQAAKALEVAHEAAIGEGKTRAFAKLTRALPNEVRAEHPWLDYAVGIALANAYSAQTLEHFETLAAQFGATGDTRGELLSVAARVESQIRSRTTHAGIRPWIARLRSLHERYAYGGDAIAELRTCASLMAGLLYFEPSDALIDSLGERTLALARVCDVADDALMTATYLLAFSELKRREDTFCQVNALARQWMVSEHASSVRVGEWLSERALLQATRERVARAPGEQSRDWLQQASDWVQHHDLKPLMFKIERIRYDVSILAGDNKQATQVLRAAESHIAPSHLLDWVTYFYKRADHAVAIGCADEALAFSEHLLRLCDEAEISESRRTIFRSMRGSALVLSKRYVEAATAFESLAQSSATAHRSHFAGPAKCLRAFDRWDTDRDSAIVLLAEGFSELKAVQKKHLFWYAPEFLATICDRALANRIEPEFANAIIVANKLAPPINASAAWPWRLKVCVMGGLRIERDDEPITFEGKAQRRPLDILAALVIAGRDEVAVESLLHRVFPSTEHDDPKGSFEVALFRLRKLLGVEGAIRLKAGRLSLDPLLVWNDLLYIDQLIDAHARAENDEQAIVHSGDLLNAYQGALFGDECQYFALARRDQLRRRIERVVEQMATLLEQRHEFERAAGVWETGLGHEPLNETFYRGLMRCHAALGNAALALSLYRRCAEMLSKMLSISPSKATEALRAEIQQLAA